jgi:hypothetical protein
MRLEMRLGRASPQLSGDGVLQVLKRWAAWLGRPMAGIGGSPLSCWRRPVESEQPTRVWWHGHRAVYPGGLRRSMGERRVDVFKGGLP